MWGVRMWGMRMWGMRMRTHAHAHVRTRYGLTLGRDPVSQRARDHDRHQRQHDAPVRLLAPRAHRSHVQQMVVIRSLLSDPGTVELTLPS